MNQIFVIIQKCDWLLINTVEKLIKTSTNWSVDVVLINAIKG